MQAAAAFLLAILGAAISARACFDVFSGRSPINIEAAFALLWLISLAFKWQTFPASEDKLLARRDYISMAILAILAMAAFGWTSRFNFIADDFVLLKHAQAPWRFDTAGKDGFLRPLGYLFNTLCWKWFAANAAEWHWMGYAIHAINCVLVYALASAMGYSLRARTIAASLFAFHGTRPEAVVWIAGRFDLLSTFAVLLSLVLVAHPKRNVLLPAVLVLMTAGLLTKESAFAFPFLAVLVIEHPRKHVAILLTIFAVAGAVFLYRWSIQGGIGGYTGAFGRPEIMSMTALTVLKALALRLWSVLFFPIDWARQAGKFLASATVVYVVALVTLFWTSPVSRRKLIQGIGFTLLAALPVVSRLLIGADMEGSRVLYLPSVGFCLMLGWMLGGVDMRLAGALTAAILLFQVAALWHNLEIWDSASKTVHAACLSVARCPSSSLVTGLPRAIEGVNAFGNGFPECVAMQSGGEVDLTQRDGVSYSCVFSWDPAKMELRQLRP